MRSLYVFGLAALLLAACSDDKVATPDIGPRDGAAEASVDAAGDLTPDAPADLGTDATDSSLDITPDLPLADLSVDQLLLEAGADLIPGVPDLTVAPANSKCTTAKAVTLTAGAATMTGTTATSLNEFAKVITCGTGYDYDGPQVYYSLPVTTGKGYKVELTPTGWDGALYSFIDKTCTATVVTTNCTGRLADEGGSGAKETILFSATATGNVTLAVDSFSPTKSGPFSLSITEFTPVKGSTCSGATSVTVGTTKVTVKGDTSVGSVDDGGSAITCGKTTALGGPQIYQKVTMTSGAAYAITLSPKFDATVYVFPAAYCGTPANIELACSGKLKSGAALGVVSSGTTSTLTFKPQSGEDYIVAVDSAGVGQSGAFTLEMQLATPKNNTCSGPETMAFTSGVATATGNNTYASNAVKIPSTGCTKTALQGADMFYSASLTANQPYLVTLYPSATLDGALYVSNSCSATGATCLSGSDSAPAGKPEMLLYTPKSTGTYIFGVGSRYKAGQTYSQGSFILGVQAYTKPTNSSCSKATSLSWVGSKATTTGNTAESTDEFGVITCGGSATFAGPQLYYKVLLTGGKKYLAKVTPAAAFDPAIYAFTATTTCSSTSVNSACKGLAADSLYGGGAESVVLTPTTSGTWVLAVDSASKSSFGPFTVTVEELPTVYNDTCASATGLGLGSGKTTLSQTGQTYGASNVVSLSSTGCTKGTSAGPDVFYKMKLDAQVTYNIKLDGTGFDEVLYLMSTCTGSNTCFTGTDKSASASEVVTITPLATQIFFIGVDGKGKADTGPFTLTVEKTPSVCPSVTALSFSGGSATVTGTTAAETSAVTIPVTGCTSLATPGPDLFLSAQLTQGKKYTITLKPTATFDPVLYLFGNCKDPIKSCLGASAISGAGKTETLTFTPPATGTYFLGVDSASSTANGSFTLTVQ